MRNAPRRVRFGGRNLLPIVLTLVTSTLAYAAPQSLKLDHVDLHYDGITEPQARALAETIETARDVYTTDLHFDMPPTIHLTVNCGPDHPTRLFNDGKDSLILSIPTPDSLQRPTKSGTFHLYGLCHELGHLAMYRPLQDRDWLTGAAAEGWAHYAGSVVVDAVHAKHGDALWKHDPYDYRADGMARLTKQFAAKTTDETVRAAGLWQSLEQTLGQENMPKLFAAWQAARIDPASPHKPLLATLHEIAGPQKKDAIETWWKSAAPRFVYQRPGSDFKRVTIDPNQLDGKPLTLKEDDDAPDGKKSIAGGGHARQFQTPAPGQWYLRAVHVHAARYGAATNGETPFDLALCDKDMKPIAVWKHPYKLFDRANAKWVRIETSPTLVPDTFNLCLVFRPTAQSGVFVSLDTSTTGHSESTTPGAQPNPLKQGDWMIRADLDRPKSADALKGQ